MPPNESRRLKKSPIEELADYSRYFHEERIAPYQDEIPPEDHVSLIDVSMEENGSNGESREPTVYFQCGMCDMLVGEKDNCCPFCGSEFEDNEYDGIMKRQEDDTSFEAEESRETLRDIDQSIERPDSELIDELEREGEREAMSKKSTDEKPEDEDGSKKVDVLGMMYEGKGYQSSGQSGGARTSSGFSQAARLLQKMENVVDKASAFGVETNDARKLLVAAWKACEEGNWNIVTSLAEETKRALVPNVSNLIREQVFSLREVILDLRFQGMDVTPQITKMKLIRKAMDDIRLDDAIELTKQLIDETRDARDSQQTRLIQK